MGLTVICATFAIAACGGAQAPSPAVSPTPSPPASPSPTRTPVAFQITPLPTASATPPQSLAVLASGALRYVAIGASDTVGVGAADPATGSWPARVATKLPPGSAYLNLGVSGSLTSQARAEQLPRALDAQPTLVSVWLAVNDFNAAVTPADYQSALAGVVDPLVVSTSARVFVGNVPDLRVVPVYRDQDPNALLASINAYNAAVAAVAARSATRVTVVDLFTGSAQLVSGATVAADGFHPSDAGYQLIADRFLAAMRAAGIAVRP